MSSDPHSPTRRHALRTAAAGVVFGLGVLAVAELALLALPGPRSSFLTWGPLITLFGGAALIAAALPAALLIEVVAAGARRRALVSLAGYLLAAVVVAAAAQWAWTAVVEVAGMSLSGTEYVAVAAGMLTVWAGARLGQRHAAAVFGFGTASLIALALATVALLA